MYYAEWKNPDIRRYILYNYISMTHQKGQNYRERRRPALPETREEKRVQRGMRELLGTIKIFHHILIVVVVT